MKCKRFLVLFVFLTAGIALALPTVGRRAYTAFSSSSPAPAPASAPSYAKTSNSLALTAPTALATRPARQSSTGSIDPRIIDALGIKRLPDGVSVERVIRAALENRGKGLKNNFTAGQPQILETDSPLSVGLLTAIGGRDNQFSTVTLLADWDGREDCTADREARVDDFSFVEPDVDFTLTRTAISEHTVANGFTENIYYYGDSVGDLWVGTDADSNGLVETFLQINITLLVNNGATNGVTLLNPQTGDCTDDQITVTGIAVNPVADLGDFGLCGVTGEVVYVSTLDTEGCASDVNGQPFRSRVFAFGFTDTPAGVASAGAIQILRSPLANLAGLAVDDDGNLYVQLMDLIQRTGAAVFKIAETPRTVCATSARINRVLNPGAATIDTLSLSTTTLATANLVATNYSGNSTLFGNIVSLASGPNNTLYAAVAAAAPTGTPPSNTQGIFPAPTQFTAGTPSMIISFADCRGAFDICSRPHSSLLGEIPVADGFADPGLGTGPVTPGVNNYRLFALGNGPDIRTGGIVPNTPASLLRIDMQFDYTIYAGISVNEDGTVYVISGGTPGGIGTNPSPGFSEILCFEDSCRKDRRGDFVDFRGDSLPDPPASGGNIGDGDSDRFDHVFHKAPLDQPSLTPAGLTGLARGFLLYTNRTRTRNAATLANLPNGATQGNDVTSGVLSFDDFDLGGQVAGGDDQHAPFQGDDNDGAGSPVMAGALQGGFEFVFGGPVAACVWNGFFLNSNGSITFGVGDTDGTPTLPEFRAGAPRIAPAWANFNPASRTAAFGTFPVQALGFSGVNSFKARWINVPEAGFEACVGLGGGATNTFSVTLFDDGAGLDENNSRGLNAANPIGNNSTAFDGQEGPTDFRFTREPVTNQLIGCPSRREGSGYFTFDYGRMDLLGTATRPVIVGYSIGASPTTNPPGLCEINLSTAAVAADTGPGVIQGQTASISACLLGEGTEPQMFELFNEGTDPVINIDGTFVVAVPSFDLRGEGNDPVACTPSRQPDLNRGSIALFGIGCSGPGSPVCRSVIPGPFVTTPTTTGLVNALCQVQLTILGCGFFPTEVTTVCQSGIGGPPRPGKTVSTSIFLACDTNGDAIPESVVELTNLMLLNENAVAGTLPVLPGLPGTAFPLACCGGQGTVVVATVFTAADNNVFGTFTKTATCSIDLGIRAPVVTSVTPSNANCAVTQDLLISGACFQSLAGPITSVFAVELRPDGTLNTANTIQATSFIVLNNNLIDAFFNFGAINNGKRFMIFVTGPGGTSRNLAALPPGAPPGCALGNEQGIQVIFTCGGGTPTPGNPDTIGTFRDEFTKFYLRNSNTSGFADLVFVFGSVGDQPLAGDYNGDGTDTVGTFRNGTFFLRNSNTTGFADLTFSFGAPGDLAIIGDWDGDGVDTVGVFRNGAFLLRNSNSSGGPDIVFSLGIAGDVPIAGDWNGDGIDTVGVYRPSTGAVFLKNSNSTGFADILLTFGLPGDKPVAGDWNGDGVDTIGVYRGDQFFLRNSNTDGFADLVFTFGRAGDKPVAGDWDGLP